MLSVALFSFGIDASVLPGDFYRSFLMETDVVDAPPSFMRSSNSNANASKVTPNTAATSLI
jgi:hypothetical protein